MATRGRGVAVEGDVGHWKAHDAIRKRALWSGHVNQHAKKRGAFPHVGDERIWKSPCLAAGARA